MPRQYKQFGVFGPIIGDLDKTVKGTKKLKGYGHMAGALVGAFGQTKQARRIRRDLGGDGSGRTKN